MIYTSLTKLAMQVAFDAHKEQKDKNRFSGRDQSHKGSHR